MPDTAPSARDARAPPGTGARPSHAMHLVAEEHSPTGPVAPARAASRTAGSDAWPPATFLPPHARTRGSVGTATAAMAPCTDGPFAELRQARRPSASTLSDATWTDDLPWSVRRAPRFSVNDVMQPSHSPDPWRPSTPVGAGVSASSLAAPHSSVSSLQSSIPLSPTAPAEPLSPSRARPMPPRHSAPHMIIDAHAAEARRRVERRSLWLDNLTSPHRVSSANAPLAPGSPHSPLRPPSPHTHAAVSPRFPVSPRTDGGARDPLHRPAPGAPSDLWKADALAPSMHWPPPKPGASPSPMRRAAGSLHITTDTDDGTPSLPAIRSASASFLSRPAGVRMQRSASTVHRVPHTARELRTSERRESNPIEDFARLSVSERTPSTPSETERSPQAAATVPTLDAGASEFVPVMPYWGAPPYPYVSLPAPARAFVIKSFTEVDVATSLRHGVWTSTEKGNNRLDQAFARSSALGPIYLFFSVNGSGRFCGVAQMVSGLDYSQNTSIWAEGHRWKGLFRVRWLIVKDVPNVHLRHILLLNRNEIKPVTQSRDTQELLPEASAELLRIFCTYVSYSTLQPPADVHAAYPAAP
ncbi:hypothetical protein MBRA1_003540 [Malassezia brasiliensis]|uniref:YTH domain-containing protein n=1 Tax=Malassezia brasiliensis TaxID=1821822 RepID=A0AAF0DWW2_9BASI|nr:hypothetical protein MBRA1_003540 [Malassezia brasiliensis]